MKNNKQENWEEEQGNWEEEFEEWFEDGIFAKMVKERVSMNWQNLKKQKIEQFIPEILQKAKRQERKRIGEEFKKWYDDQQFVGGELWEDAIIRITGVKTMKKEIKIILKGEPISTQTIYKCVCRDRFSTMYMTKRGKDLKEWYQIQARQQYKGMLHCDVEIDIKLYFKDKRKRDIDNFEKILLDALSGIIYEDDKQIKRMCVEKFIDKNNPRIEVKIKNLES